MATTKRQSGRSDVTREVPHRVVARPDGEAARGGMRPFVKWVGGKRQILSSIMEHLPEPGEGFSYHEPFLGAGAVALHVASRWIGTRVMASDLNDELMTTWRVVRDQTDALIERLGWYGEQHSRTFYYEVRALAPDDPVDRAARMIYLNRTCFNGLYRLNLKGGFNVPIGRGKRITIVDAPNLRQIANITAGWTLETSGWTTVLDRAVTGDVVFLDPPYVPLSRTAKFVDYTAKGFDWATHEALAEGFRELAQRGCTVILTNHDTPEVRGLYQGFAMHSLDVRRYVNRDSAGRTGTELMVVHRAKV